MKLDKVEKDILSAHENGSIKTKAPSKKILKEIIKASELYICDS